MLLYQNNIIQAGKAYTKDILIMHAFGDLETQCDIGTAQSDQRTQTIESYDLIEPCQHHELHQV